MLTVSIHKSITDVSMPINLTENNPIPLLLSRKPSML